MSYQTSILFDTIENLNFRTVLYTGEKSQLVVMNIPPGGEIGLETHKAVEQVIFVQSGDGFAFCDDKRSALRPGDVLVVTPGTAHNVVNVGEENLKLYTIYTPPNHLDGRIHATLADADLDKEDEEFGAMIGEDGSAAVLAEILERQAQ